MSAVIFIPTGNMFPHYIKKEDARDIPKTQRKGAGIVLIGMGVVLGIMQYFVLPKLHEMYYSIGYQMPFFVKNAPLITLLFGFLYVAIGVYFLSTEPNYEKIDRVIKKYKSGEMIKTKEIMNNSIGIWLFLGLGIGVGFLVLSIILPIYSITDSI